MNVDLKQSLKILGEEVHKLPLMLVEGRCINKCIKGAGRDSILVDKTLGWVSEWYVIDGVEII